MIEKLQKLPYIHHWCWIVLKEKSVFKPLHKRILEETYFDKRE